MDTRDEHVSCCFRCAMKSQDIDMQIPQLVQNAYPGLVSKDWRFAKTQPFIRAYYLPTPTINKRRGVVYPFYLAEKMQHQKQRTNRATLTLDDLNEVYIYEHEYTHFSVLNRTPAKDLARLHLAFAYDSLCSLMNAKTSSEMENACNRFREAQLQLDKIHNNIAFVEELLATAHAFERMEYGYLAPERPFAGFQEQFEELKQKVLQNEEGHFPKNEKTGFPGYTATYKRVRRFLEVDNIEPQPLLIQWGIICLQAVELSSLWTSKYSMRFFSLDAKERLDYLLNIAENTSNLEEADKLLKPHIEKVIEVWKELVGLMYMNADMYISWENAECLNVQIPQAFWLISHGQYKYCLEFNRAEEFRYYYINQTFNEYFSNTRFYEGVLLYRDVYRGQSYVANSLVNLTEQGIGYKKSYRGLLFYEALRQQIEARKGIVCPFNMGRKRCMCSKGDYDNLLRLSHLAKDDRLFGDGNWSLLPCRN